MDVITHIRTFVAVVRGGSFTEAAARMGVVPSVVARRISQLESELNSQLFERSTRKVALTESGERFYARAAGIVEEFEELMSAVERDAGKLEGHIRVMAPTTITLQQLGKVFCRFLKEHPRISLQISLVDHSANPAESGYDIAISGRLASYDGVVDIPLRPVNPILCAAPDYLQGKPQISHPRDLANHGCLVFTPTGSTWNFQSSKGVVSVDVTARLQADDNITLLEAAQDGLGVALLPEYVVANALKAKHIVQLLPDFAPQENWFKAYVPRRRLRSARVKALLDWLNEEWK